MTTLLDTSWIRSCLVVTALATAVLACAGQTPEHTAEPAASGADVAASSSPPETRPYLVSLGTAQDGGIPQTGTKDGEAWRDTAKHRQVVCLALIDPLTGERWLFEATPDLPEQLAELDEIAPHPEKPGLEGVFLTHAHMGHYTGLMFLGFESLGASLTPVYAMPRMASYLSNNGPWDQLIRYENIDLRTLQDAVPVELNKRLRVVPFLVPHRQEYSEVVGYRIESTDPDGLSALFIPDINSWEEWDEWGVRLEDQIASVDVAFLDGCFWNHGEVPGRDMSGFPHPLIKETLDRLSALPPSERSKIVFTHINHTNPVQDPNSPEAREVESWGARVAQEGGIVGL